MKGLERDFEFSSNVLTFFELFALFDMGVNLVKVSPIAIIPSLRALYRAVVEEHFGTWPKTTNRCSRLKQHVVEVVLLQ